MKKKIIPLLLAVLSYAAVNNAQAIDFGKFMKNLFSTHAAAKAEENDDGKDVEKFRRGNCTGLNPWGQPLIKDDKLMERSLFICRTIYGMQYDSLYKTPIWVSEVLEKNNITKPHPEVKYSPIMIDPDLPQGMQVKLEDYKGTGYEPFTLAPYPDLFLFLPGMKDELVLDKNQRSVDEGARATNTLPMVPSLRKGLWQQLEMQVRVSLSKPNRQQLFILTGPIYQNGKTLGMIGKNGVPIPTHYYKILVDPDTDGSLTYIIPNQNILTPGYTGDKKNLFTCNGGACDLNNFISSVKEAERLTGFTFYPKLAPQYATKVKLDASEYLKKRETNLK